MMLAASSHSGPSAGAGTAGWTWAEGGAAVSPAVTAVVSVVTGSDIMEVAVPVATRALTAGVWNQARQSGPRPRPSSDRRPGSWARRR